MSDERAKPTSWGTLRVEHHPERVAPGESVDLVAYAAPDPPRDLRGEPLRYLDPDGNLIGEVTFDAFDGETNSTSAFEAVAPSIVGDVKWTAVLPREGGPGAAGDGASTPVHVEVVPHDVELVVWGAPKGIPAGTAFPLYVGVRSSSGELLSGHEVRVVDHEGKMVATAATGEEPWPGTTALAYTQVYPRAPQAEGTYTWQAVTPASEGTAPHRAGDAAFRVRTAPHPEARVTVHVKDVERDAPAARAHVLMHPFRGYADEHGTAVFDVPRGEYKVHVSGGRFLPYDERIEVEDDVEVNVELEREPEPENV